MNVTNEKRREVAAKVRETMGALGQVELDGIPLADLIEPEECDGCEPGAWEVVAMEAAERLGVAVGGCLPSDYADAIGDALDRRLMPEGMEWLLDVWPKWSNGEYCKFGDWWKSDKYGEFEPQQLSNLSIYTPEQLREWGQGDGDHYGYQWDFVRPNDPTYRPDKVEPPAPKVLDADGVEIRVGNTVYEAGGTGHAYKVVSIRVGDGSSLTPTCVTCDEGDGTSEHFMPDHLTHRAPVFAADGRPLREGETVWHEDGAELRVVGFGHEEDGETLVEVERVSGPTDWGECRSLSLTHELPDSWERLEDDATKQPYVYCFEHGLDDDSLPTNEKFARDLVRRAKALAVVSE